MDIGYPLFSLAFILGLVFAAVQGMYVFSDVRVWSTKGSVWTLWNNIQKSERALGLIVVTFAAFYLVAMAQPLYASVYYHDYTPAVHALEGDGHILALQAFDGPVVTSLASFVYIFGFSFLMLFSVLLLVWTDGRRALRELAHQHALMALIALPLFVLFPVTVASLYEPSLARPLLYQNEYLYNLAASGGLHNSFPSSHTYITTGTFLVMLRQSRKYKRWTTFCGLMAIAIPFVILFLGIHWLVDILGGLAVATLAAFIIHKTRYLKWVDGLFGKDDGG